MPAKHHINNRAQLILTTWESEADDIGFIETVSKYQNNILSKLDYSGYNEVVNFCKTTDIKLIAEGLKTISQIASRTDRNRVTRKLALIVSSNLAFGLARMYQAYRKVDRSANKEVRIFKKESDAVEWAKDTT
jgi:hypothetical protein